MKKAFRNFRDSLVEDLKDRSYAQTYLAIALEQYEDDKDINAFLAALKDVAEAQGGLTKLAKKTQLNRQNLYKALSAKGNPRFDTVETVLHGLGYRLSIEAVSPS
jgi:probable addiction module antidote protein